MIIIAILLLIVGFAMTSEGMRFMGILVMLFAIVNIIDIGI